MAPSQSYFRSLVWASLRMISISDFNITANQKQICLLGYLTLSQRAIKHYQPSQNAPPEERENMLVSQLEK
jgi:hypothetical protein